MLVIAALLLPSLPFAAAQEPAVVVLFEDARGDAMEAGAGPSIQNECPDCPVPAPLSGLGVPAPPGMDLVAFTMRETPEDVVASFVVASLEEGLPGVVSDEGRGRGAQYTACWDWAGASCNTRLIFFARRQGGTTFLHGLYSYQDDACNTRATCGWGVPFDLEYGSPGAIHLRIPRATLPLSIEQGDIIQDVVATVGRLSASPAVTGMGALPPLVEEDSFHPVDVGGPGPAKLTLSLARAHDPPGFAPVGGYGPGLIVGDDPVGGVNAEADLLNLTLVETPSTITFSFLLAGVTDAPNDQVLTLEFAFAGGRYHVAEVVAADRQRTMESFACEPSEDVPCATREPVPATFEAEPGAPGYLHISFLRTDLAAPEAGAQTTRVAGFVSGGPTIRAGAASEFDMSGLLPPIVLRYATRAEEVPPGAYRLDDSPADARVPGLGQPEEASGAEILHAEARIASEGGVRLTLGVRDPARDALPLGYSALVRAIALDERGRTTLVAAYRDASGESYFCATDTVVFAPSRSIPPPQVRSAVPASVSAGEAGGNITFDVPASCLAPTADVGNRSVTRMGAGAYLVRGPGLDEGEVVLVDEAIGAEPFVLAPLPGETVAPAPPVAAPFPWVPLILGALALVVVSVGAPLLLVRRRRARLVMPAPGVLFLGKYLVDRELGRGGFGAVWLATHTKLGRAVVIKQLHPGWAADPKAVERFRAEARLLAKLDHPRVVKVYDAEELEGHAFLVMEYVEGGSLAELRPKPAPLPLLARIGDELLDALSAIHAQGIVHGDLKPENVLLAADGALRVADFGIARPVDPAPSGMRTMGYGSADLAGTPLFMAPEQLEGERATPASDLYAAGAVLHHVATGRLLFTPAPMDVESARMAHARGAPDAGEGMLHPALAGWLRRALARDARDRFPSADAMREAWGSAVALARAA